MSRYEDFSLVVTSSCFGYIESITYSGVDSDLLNQSVQKMISIIKGMNVVNALQVTQATIKSISEGTVTSNLEMYSGLNEDAEKLNCALKPWRSLEEWLKS
jgi:NifU-like protein involved in Fe-S cluster formation